MKEGKTLDDLYNERLPPLYEKYAEITVNCSRKSLTSNVQRKSVRTSRKLYNLY